MSGRAVVEHWTFGPEQGVPAPIAPYAHAVRAGSFLFVTGQLPVDPETGRLVSGAIVEQTHAVMRNLRRVLELCGAGLADVVQARAYITSMDLYSRFNDVYDSWFPDRVPARTCVAVSGLALGALVEVDVVAFVTDED